MQTEKVEAHAVPNVRLHFQKPEVFSSRGVILAFERCPRTELNERLTRRIRRAGMHAERTGRAEHSLTA
ncbi:hypothetical protein C1280_34795 [Gemmata obscuriglobus]|uniref:Uncharacterized protein n=1 Tax=Gemmata obscuriglobus TaxID=114 RepID=A0A2Z3HJM9_9BACT|nr:hypothetical protein C1280_34795 [Gemmata obscuriglobus]